jgi:uncharacterized membrane protein YccC
MNIRAALNWCRAQAIAYGAQLRFCLRMTVAAVLAFVLAQVWNLPLHGLWAVLTAVVVTQISVGGSLHATTEYVMGTIVGAVYAAGVGILVPHTTTISLAGVLALTIGPLAYAAAVYPSFRVAPFTGAIVLLISTQFGEGLIESALYRLAEVALGGAVAFMVSLLVMPQRAHELALDVAARILDLLARLLPKLLAGFTRELDVSETTRLQQEAGLALTQSQTITAEAQREHLMNLLAAPDSAPLARTLLRLRHDLVIIGRAAAAPLPKTFAECLGPLLIDVGERASAYLLKSARALTSRCSPPSLEAFDETLTTFNSEIASLRRQGLTRTLSIDEAEQLFALGFALEQLHRNFSDLERCIEEWARPNTKLST